MKYNVRLSVKNSKGNEVAKVWNVNCSINFGELTIALWAFAKRNYNVQVNYGYKKHRGKACTLEELLSEVKNFRFKEVVTSSSYQYVANEKTMSIPLPPYTLITWCSDWHNKSYTFFQIQLSNTLIEPSFKEFRELFEKNGLSLRESCTEGIWFVVDTLKIKKEDDALVISWEDPTFERVFTRKEIIL